MLQVNNLSLKFNTRVLFENVNLKFEKGNCYGVIGANGAGKSTLMKVLSGIHEPTKGTITINNINYNKLDHKLAKECQY